MTEACDGREALDACLASAPDVILLDWNMPVMSGMDFLRALRESAIPSRPKVVFCTTENGMAYIRAAIDAGADEYVMKPFDRVRSNPSSRSSASPEPVGCMAPLPQP